jgi:hypothetical protein
MFGAAGVLTRPSGVLRDTAWPCFGVQGRSTHSFVGNGASAKQVESEVPELKHMAALCDGGKPAFSFNVLESQSNANDDD